MWISFTFLDCVGGLQNSSNRRKNKVKTEVNQLEVEFIVTNRQLKKAEEFQAQAIFTNKSGNDLRLNALFLDFAPILLKTRYQDGTPVFPTSPPFPPEDDGNTGRINLKPGESATFTYRGVDYFGTPLREGKYQLRFRYENKVSKYGDWTGLIESDWVDFEVRP
jgi:hypothetical protein